MTNMRFSHIDDVRDIQSINHYREALAASDGASAAEVFEGVLVGGRDNARTPMQWSAAPNAGFTEGEPWIAVNPNHSWLNAEAQRAQERSVFAWYRSLIALRHEDRLVVTGDFALVLPDHPQLFAYTRTHPDDGGMLVLANFSGGDVPVPDGVLHDWADAEQLLANHLGDRRFEPVMLPWEVRVLRLR